MMTCSSEDQPVFEEQQSQPPAAHEQPEIELQSVPSNIEGKCVPICYYPNCPSPLPAETTLPPMVGIVKARELLAEWLGTGLLVGCRQWHHSITTSSAATWAFKLIINAFATVAGLYGLITMLDPIIGAHFNPCVSLVDFLFQ